MRIYTKTDDSSTTALIGGKRVPKYDDRIEEYGPIDELVSFLGLFRSFVITRGHQTVSFCYMYSTTCGRVERIASELVDRGVDAVTSIKYFIRLLDY